jgi:hypothetical protein
VKDAFDRIKESLSTLMVDYQIPSIIVSPIVEIFPYTENLDREIERKSIEPLETVVEHTPTSKGQVFSAPGSDIDDEELEDFDADDSELEDDYADEE